MPRLPDHCISVLMNPQVTLSGQGNKWMTMKSVALISRSLPAVYITIIFIWYLQKLSTFFFFLNLNVLHQKYWKIEQNQTKRKKTPKCLFWFISGEIFFNSNCRFFKIISYWSIVDSQCCVSAVLDYFLKNKIHWL